MLHRRIIFDDHRGVKESLNERNPWNNKGLEVLQIEFSSSTVFRSVLLIYFYY